MSRVSGTIKGDKDLVKALKKLEFVGHSYMEDAVRDSTLVVHARAIKLIQDNSGGTRTVRYSPRRTVTVSKPGKPPNTDTGRLVQSIKFDLSNDGLEGRVGTNLKYGRALEFGTKKMSARPWLSTAIRLEKKEVRKIFNKNLKKALKKVGS